MDEYEEGDAQQTGRKVDKEIKMDRKTEAIDQQMKEWMKTQRRQIDIFIHM